MPAQEPQQSMLHLLIVEDVMADVDLMLLALETVDISCTYDTADNHTDCQHLLQTQTYDAVLADYRLPQFTAYQVLELLQASGQEIPLILVTGSLGEEAAVECIKAGMTDYVLKDRLFRLPMALQRALGEFELRRQQKAAVNRIQQQAQREAIINQIVQAMRETLILDDVLQTTADALHEAFNVSRCLIFQPNSQQEMWIYYVSAATAERDLFVGIKCPLHPVFKMQLERGEIITINSIDANSPPTLQDIANTCQVRALMIVPLVYQQVLLGGIILHQCDRDRVWNSEEIALIKAISDQCAIALHQAELFHQVQQQTHWERTLNQIFRALNSSLDPNYILAEIVKLTGECFAVERVVVYAVAADTLQVANEWRSHEQIPSLLSDMTTNNETLANFADETIFRTPNLEKIYTNLGRAAVVKKMENLSVVSVPIFIREKLFGGISLQTTIEARIFTKEEINLLQRIADTTAIALYNAQSYERLEELVTQRTHELEAEKHLSEAANRAKSEFLSNMSHELRTPLTGILGFTSILLEEVFGKLSEKQKQYLDLMYKSGKHLLELINDLLDLSKIEAGKEELNLETLEVAEICNICLSMFADTSEATGIKLNCAIAANVTTCIADQRRLKQILVNLLSNAFKFTNHGSVTLDVEQTKNIIAFSVIDTGIGISVDEQATLFQPFHQLDSGLDRKYEGTGLGLALSRKLARLHGGDLTVNSTVGCGSCFALTLPLSSPNQQI